MGYLPDLAETIVELLEHDPLPNFARFHMDGHWDADGTQMAAAIVRALGNPEVRVRPLPWWTIALLAPFVRELKELAELKYLWARPVRLCNEHLVATLGREPHTKRILKLDKLRLRCFGGAQDEFLLAATAQNLRRMAKWLMPKADEVCVIPA